MTLPAPKKLTTVEILWLVVVVVVLAPVVATLVVFVCEPDKRTPEPCAPEMVPFRTKVPALTLILLRPDKAIPVPLIELPLIDKLLPLATVRLKAGKAAVASVELPLE